MGMAVGVEPEFAVFRRLPHLLPGHEVAVALLRRFGVDEEGEGVAVGFEEGQAVFVEAFEAVVDRQHDPSVGNRFTSLQGFDEA